MPFESDNRSHVGEEYSASTELSLPSICAMRASGMSMSKQCRLTCVGPHKLKRGQLLGLMKLPAASCGKLKTKTFGAAGDLDGVTLAAARTVPPSTSWLALPLWLLDTHPSEIPLPRAPA